MVTVVMNLEYRCGIPDVGSNELVDASEGSQLKAARREFR